MIIQAVLSSRAMHLALIKKDSPRHIDRVIDYFGDGRPPATTRQTTGDESAGDDASSQDHVDRLARPPPPYTFVVMGVLIVVLGVFAIVTTPTDIFPEIEIPVVSVIWNYGGLSVDEMAARITTYSEYTISSVVNDVRSIESHTYPGVSVIRSTSSPT